MNEQINRDRKAWHRLETQFNESIKKCEHCGGPLEETVSYQPDPVGIIYDQVCKNPDCVINQ